jgi:hypothetical protein
MWQQIWSRPSPTHPPAQTLGIYLLQRLFKEVYTSQDAYMCDIKAVSAFLVRVMDACAKADESPGPAHTPAGVTVSLSHPGFSVSVDHGRRLLKMPNWLFAKVPGSGFDWDPLTVGLGLAIGVAVGATAVLVAPIAAPVAAAVLAPLVGEGVAAAAAPIVTGLVMAEWATVTGEMLDEEASKVLNLPKDRQKELEIGTKAGILLTDVVDFASNAAEASWEGLEIGKRVWSKDPEGFSTLVNNLIIGGKGRKSIRGFTSPDPAKLAGDFTGLEVTVRDAADLFSATREGQGQCRCSQDSWGLQLCCAAVRSACLAGSPSSTGALSRQAGCSTVGLCKSSLPQL